MQRIEQSREASLSELRGVVAVAAHRSFRRAAEELGMSTSALSHAVASVEQRLGVKLFHRTTRSVSVSEAGARFVERVQPALRQLADAVETANDFRGTPRGTLRLNTSLGAARRIFEPLVLEFVTRYPDMHVDLVTDARFVDIVAGGFDAGIRLAEAVPQGMVSVPCGPPLRFVVVGSKEYFRRHPRPSSPSDLLAHRCIRRRIAGGPLLRWEFEKNGEELRLDVQGPLTLDEEELVVTAALRGLGLAWLNRWAVEGLLAERKLVPVLDDWLPEFPGMCLYYPPSRHMSAGLRAFVDLVRERERGRGQRG